MPREHKTTVYQYSELSNKAKKKAREEWINDGMAWDGHDSKQLTEVFKELLQEKGFEKGVDVEWSLNSSQGDGVAFSGTLDIPRYIKAQGPEFGSLIGHVTVVVKHSGHYTHRNSMTVEVHEEDTGDRGGPKDWHPGRPSSEKVKAFEEHIKEDVKDISRELEKIGTTEIEFHYSEEYITEYFEANNHEFTEEGKFFRA